MSLKINLQPKHQKLIYNDGCSLPRYPQSFILSFNGWRQAISCSVPISTLSIRLLTIEDNDGRSLPCYLQSFILSFHGWRQAISCLLNLMGATFAQVGLRDTQPTPPDLLLA